MTTKILIMCSAFILGTAVTMTTALQAGAGGGAVGLDRSAPRLA